MIPLTWSKRWYQAGISLWALAARISFVSTASIETVLEYLVGASRTNRSPIWFGTTASIEQVVYELQLPFEWVRAAFCSPGPPSLDHRRWFRLALRWCPECLRSWYHAATYQDVRLERCPVHDVPLTSRCPSCNRIVDPLKVVRWRCFECKAQLAPAPEDWRADFARNLPALPVVKLSVPIWRRADAGGSVWISASAPSSRQTPYGSRAERFELLSAMWATMASGHRECAVCEDTAAMGQYGGFKFACPVAAALLQCALTMGCDADRRSKERLVRCLLGP